VQIRRDTDNLLFNLQFQDRMSQILGAIGLAERAHVRQHVLSVTLARCTVVSMIDSISVMRSAMRLPAMAEVCDSSRMALAMMPKPRPASPACAASIAALMARMFVWAAIWLTS
jgi:hypothetical protein